MGSTTKRLCDALLNADNIDSYFDNNADRIDIGVDLSEFLEEKLKESRTDKASGDEEETVMISASSLEELLQKIDDYSQNERMYSMQSEEEKQIGQHIDFRG